MSCASQKPEVKFREIPLGELTLIHSTQAGYAVTKKISHDLSASSPVFSDFIVHAFFVVVVLQSPDAMTFSKRGLSHGK